MIYLFEDGILADMPYAPGPVTDIHGIADIEYVDLWWTDPTDRLWGGTVIVRKEGSYPQSVNDGTIVFESTKRNAYQYDRNIMGFRDEGLNEQTTYYYSFFTYSRKHQYDLAMPGHFMALTGSKFVIKFVSEGEVLQELHLLPGEMPSYSGSLEQNKAGDRNFDTWSPAFYAADKDQTYSAVFHCLLHYKNYNGGTDLYTEQVKHGANGVWSGSATRAQDNSHIYTFTGWSSRQGGNAEPDCRSNLQEDRTVYAAYSSEDRTYTVTFMNGTSVYDTVQVSYGSTAACSKSNPVKSSDWKYSYSFVGWNSANSQTTATAGILNNITSDKTVYAAYSQTLKSYTITWRNLDGTLLKSETLSAGTTPKYSGTPSFAGWKFKGWSPDIYQVTGNATCYATYEMPEGMSNTITATWDDVIEAAESNRLSGFDVGDTKIALTTDNKPICFELAGIRADSAGKLTFISKTTYGSAKWNTSDTTSGGYPQSNLKNYIETTCYNHMPANIRNAMKTVTKYCYSATNPKNRNLSYSAKIWAPSVRELNDPIISVSNGHESQGPQYTFYRGSYEDHSGQIQPSNRIRYTPDGQPMAVWCRSAYSSTMAEYLVANAGGSILEMAPSSSVGVVFGFVL